MYNWQLKNWPRFEFKSSTINIESMRFILKAGEQKGIIALLSQAISTAIIMDDTQHVT